MARLPVVSGQEMIKYLKGKGFYVSRIKGSHHMLKSENDPRRLVVIPLHDELDPGTLTGILKDAGIGRDDFIREWNS